MGMDRLKRTAACTNPQRAAILAALLVFGLSFVIAHGGVLAAKPALAGPPEDASGPGPGKVPDAMDDISFFGSIKDRSTGTKGSEQAADYILKAFKDAGMSQVGTQEFLTPVPELESASLEVDGKKLSIYPWGPNLVTLPVTPKEGIAGPLIYVENGSFDRFDSKPVRDSIVVMDMDSYGNWANAAMLGARAVIFLGDQNSISGEFKEKNTSTPLAFPRFWVPPDDAPALKKMALEGTLQATVKSQAKWQNKLVRNCYGLVLGKDPKLNKELIVLDAFYDASSPVLGLAPGADESTSIAMLLSLARTLAREPPARSVLFVATTGNGQGLAGMRQFIWAAASREKRLKREKKELYAQKEKIDHQLDLIESKDPLDIKESADLELVWQVVLDQAKDKADSLTREIQYEKALSRSKASTGESAVSNIEDPTPYRRLAWRSGPKDLTLDQRALALKLIHDADSELMAQHKELKRRLIAFKSSIALRSLIDRYRPVLFMSLYFSSHSPNIGLVEMGETYPVLESVKRTVRAARLVEFLNRTGSDVSEETGMPNLVKDLSRAAESEESPGRSQMALPLCCDVGVLAGLPAVSLMTPDDNRSFWSTPLDETKRVDAKNIELLSRFLPKLLGRLFSYPLLKHSSEGGIPALASLEGQAMFIRQGELFPDQPAPGTIISVIQGNSAFKAMTYRDGTFFIPGLANRRVALEKLILEPYGINPKTGRIAWTADKAQTRKENYRIKVKSDLASTSLVMFHCEQTDIVGVFNPQDTDYLTKVDLLDASSDSTPLRYWYSRMDGRNTTAVSVFLEKGSRFKLLLAESLLRKEMLLLNASDALTTGKGFLIGDPALIPLAPQKAAQDLSILVGQRLGNLFEHGIINRSLESLYDGSIKELDQARSDLSAMRYSDYFKNVVSAWAKLDTVYSEIETVQRDVLGGVMFFIALFVPFAFCMERYIFAARGIYRQIAGFFFILIITILAIRSLHPAFQLTYSPMVVIVAFFIVGLSFLVSCIIFLRFEREMSELHRSSAHMKTPQAGKWQAFGAGFSIGVSNLNRRRLRTGLTCLTLVILTFTVMSFTNVKSLHKTTQTRLGRETPYTGILLRNQYRLPLPFLALEEMKANFGGLADIWPRAWIEPTGSASQRSLATVRAGSRLAPVEGILGLGSHPPPSFEAIVTSGRWIGPAEENALMLCNAMAQQLGLDPEKDRDATVSLMGDTFKVVGWFSEKRLDGLRDLDQNPVTPAYLEVSQNEELSEVEMEAMQSGEVILPQTERFRYANANATIILPFRKCISYGGVLKAISILPASGQSPLAIADKLSSWLNFPLFVGEKGTWYLASGTTLHYQGASNLIVPILIVVFITLNTMIGHVHERRKEIATYTSIGLAPNHVGFLFIVEALSMAVIATVIGYILAQLSAAYLGNTPAFSQLTFNYSSLASVACMLLVFSVVFLASLYPAKLAAEIAMPDVNRTWTLPEPEGDALFLNLPFLLKYEEERGVMGFLKDFYASHQDAAHGSFIADETSLDADVPEVMPGAVPMPVCFLIRTNVWLAPFDFGIKQRLQLHCCPSQDNPGYLEIAIQMIRISGERSAWVRANRNFIKAVRKQMLLWRFLDEEEKTRIGETVGNR